jgi:hypothetical protein
MRKTYSSETQTTAIAKIQIRNTYSEKTRHLGHTQRTIIAPLLGEGKQELFAQCSVHASSNMHINYTVRIIVPFGTESRKENAQKTLN